MKAYKPFSAAPTNAQISGISPDYPWQMQTCTEAEADALTALGFTVVSDEAYDELLASLPAPPAKVPQIITPRQVRLAMIAAGISLSTIDGFIQSLPEPTKSQAFVWWEYSLEFQRNNGLMNALAPQLNLSQTDLDNLFILGASL